ncbi:hypothetical protein pb186bvf_001056 [Paramecium bursaria]
MNCCKALQLCFERLRYKFGGQYELAATPKHQYEKKTLVLDLDETLVHCEFRENQNFNHEAVLDVIHKGQLYKVYIRRRPYLTEFLQMMSEIFEIIIFTAGYESYCEKVLQYIDNNKTISDYYARSSCQFIEGNCIKDLTLLERPLDGLIFIDNNPNAFDLQPDNGLLIPSFLDSDEDDCLMRLIPFLKFMASKRDIRPLNSYKQNYEKQHGCVFQESHVTMICQPDQEDDNLSEGQVVKIEEDYELKHRKTQTLADQSTKILNNKRSATLFSG